MLKRAIASTWEKYQHTYAYLKFANRAGGGAIKQVLNRKLSIASEKRQFAAAEMTRQQFVMQVVLDPVHRRALSTTLGVIN